MRASRLTTLLATTVLAAGMATTASAQMVEDNDIVSLTDWNYDELYTGGRSVEQMIDDGEVYGMTGDEIGTIENVLFGPDGKVVAIIAQVGGLWDIGDTHVSIPWDRVEWTAEGVRVPVTEDTVDDYSLYTDEVVTQLSASANIQEVDDDLETGGRIWRATELIDDYVRLRDGDAYVNYGYVSDIIIRDGQVASVVVDSDVGWAGARGAYAYPYYGYRYGWNPGLDYYNMPYGRDEVAELEPLDYERFE